MMVWTIALGFVIVCLLWDVLRPDPAPISGVYRLPGRCYYIKRWIFAFLLWLNSKKKVKDEGTDKTVKNDRNKRGYGHSINDPAQLEACQVLEQHPYAIDTTYFNGFGADGTNVALRVARKHGREAEVWVWLELPGVGFLQHPLHPDTMVCNAEPDSFSAAGCKFQLLEPMRRWKLTFNGNLRHGLCNNVNEKPSSFLHTEISLIWECFADPFNFDLDLDKGLLCDAIAREKWTKEFWTRLRGKHQTHYEQVGELHGRIQVQGYPERRVHLKSFRDHTFGVRDWSMFYRYAIHFIQVPETGVMAMVAVLCMPDYMSYLRTGYLVYANGETWPVSEVNLDLWDITALPEPPDTYSFSFKAGGDLFQVSVQSCLTPTVYHYSDRRSKILERFCTYVVNGRAARGLTEYHYRNPEGPPMTTPVPESVPILTEPDLTDVQQNSRELTLTFQETACGSSQLVGGKGSQLALLTRIQDQVGVVVPKGFCLTLEAFDAQLQANPSVEESIQLIIEDIRHDRTEAFFSSCSNAVEQIASCQMIGPVEDQLVTQLSALFGESYHQVSLAVRSSAAGEDGVEASSAGQMETFLGVRGRDKIMDAVKKCWSSAYTYTAVQYRRMHGQPIRTAVGVVLQEMVQSEVSGVLFTNDPVTGSPNTMVLDAAFGLGEVVVSGQTTPDLIKVSRSWDNELQIAEKVVRDKTVQMKVTDSGVVTETCPASISSSCCLSDDQILQLCNTAVKVEQYFGSGRDIEWAICQNVLYLLQARPITTLEQVTDEDYIHEFDSPLVTDMERTTLGNIGEMMPGCITPLSNSLFMKAVDDGTCDLICALGGCYKVKSAPRFMVSCCGRLFLNLTWASQVSTDSLIGKKEALEMNIMGQILEDHTKELIGNYGRRRAEFFQKLLSVIQCFRWSGRQVKRAEQWAERVKTYQIGEHCDTATELWEEIDNKLPDYWDVWATTLVWSSSSGNWGGITMGVVSGGKDEWSVDNYADISLLLSHCNNVYSAEVPSAMQELAESIVSSGHEEMFLEGTDEECATALSSGACGAAVRQKYETFLQRHGHRCIREAEFREKSWRAEPEKLVRVIKTIVKTKAYLHKPPEGASIEEAVSKLKSPVSSIGKFLLRKYIVPRARQAVGQREFGKSVAIQMVDRFKVAYWRLADMMVFEGRLPEGDLLFFLTHKEIGKLLRTRSANLIARAMRRRNVLPIQSKLEFPKICIGRPEPVSASDDAGEERKASFTLKGMPVSQGSVKAAARVVTSLEDASSIQRGEVLVVCYTDIGWSPYFPLISGLVTEMGGLVSHGAVVAREYGLPCIVNVAKATRLLKSGDEVHLDGATGCIHKLE